MIESKFELTDFKAEFFLFLFSLLIYIHTISFGIIYLDDHLLVVDNAYFFRKIENLFLILTTDVYMDGSTFYYRPLLNVSFMLNFLLNGPRYFYFHLTNIILHSFSGILLFKMIRKFEIAIIPSFAFSLLFLAHPTLVPSVVWLPGRNDSLLFVFSVLFILSFFNYVEKKSIKYAFSSSFFFALSMFTKETAIALPVIVALYCFLFKKWNRQIVSFFIISLAIIAFWLFLRQKIIKPHPILILNPFLSFKTFLFMLGKGIFPLSPQIWLPVKSMNYQYGIVALILLAPLIFFAIKQKNRVSIFGLIWYFVFILPFLILYVSHDGIGNWEQRLYVPMAGVMLFFAGLKWEYFLKISNHLKAAIFVILLILFSSSCVINSFFFANEILFWEKVVYDFPENANACAQLAYTYQLNNLYSLAEMQYRKVLSLNPKQNFIHHNLGIIYLIKGEKEKAKKEFKLELKNNPSYAKYVKLKDKSDIKKLRDLNFNFYIKH